MSLDCGSHGSLSVGLGVVLMFRRCAVYLVKSLDLRMLPYGFEVCRRRLVVQAEEFCLHVV